MTTLNYFGSQLKLLRGRAGLSRAELGAKVGYSETTLASVEQGWRFPQQDLIEKADEALGAGGILRTGAKYLVPERFPPWFEDFVLMEANAVSLQSYETQVIPGLLQTENYVRAVISARCPPLDDDDVERRVDARLERQRLLTGRPAPVLGFVIEEVVLHRPIGGRESMREQLRRLLECANMRHISVQIMPTCRETHTGLDGPLVLLETPERRQVAYAEAQGGAFLVFERNEVSMLTQRYGIIRAQALSLEESVNCIEQVLAKL